MGDNRTREELNAMGIPAQYLDLGVVVQPMFYYMGHISRHVRPGARAINAIFDLSRVFRHVTEDGKVIAGGGINNLARSGVEITLWPCEGSTRQLWEFDILGHLKVYGHDWLGQPMISCVGKEPDPFFDGLLLTECDENSAIFDLVEIPDMKARPSNSQSVRFILRDGDSQDACLIAIPVANHGGSHGLMGGSQATIGRCDESSVSKIDGWFYK